MSSGFYGNITSQSKTQFNFDKIFPNRTLMDTNVDSDGVFIGRYVLVEYDIDSSNNYITAYTDGTNFYTSPAFEETTIIEPKNNIIVQVVETDGKMALYRGIQGSWVKVTSADSEYVYNYNVDIAVYGAGRGFDSTVWQKIFTDGQQKYVMIAELNSVVPTFGISADAPSMVPITPHFDKRSTNTYYNLHWQPTWGFRIKSAYKDEEGSDGLEYSSDEKVTWIESKYDEETQSIITTSNVVDGAIFYNKDGFDPKVRSYVENLENHIKIAPTGKSGLEYSNHSDDGSTSIQPDIQELSIILPAIGNTISDIWDLTYGKERNLDINWNSYNGLRLVKERPNSSGFDYAVEDVQTIAGVINSVHDLMGQVIIDDIPADYKDLDEDSIYYSSDSGAYYRKFINYAYNKVDNVDLITSEQLYSPAGTLIDYIPNKYYTAHGSKDYYLEKGSKFYNSRNYYEVEMQETPLSTDYEKGTLYYKQGNSYILENNETARNVEYYKITDSAKIEKFYQENYYFYKDASGKYAQDASKTMTKGREYFTIEGGQTTVIMVEKTDEQGKKYYEEQTINVGGTPVKVYLTQFEDNVYYLKVNETNYNLMTKDDITKEYQSVYTLSAEKQPTFYSSGVYYYKENDNYIFDKLGNVYDKNKIYYTKQSVVKTANFYHPDSFYYTLNGEYILDSNPTLTVGRTYYIKNNLYVVEDENEVLLRGMPWDETKTPPTGVSVGFRTGIIDLEELEGFARSFNTIHGLILHLRSILDDIEADSRDTSTIRGCINTIKDIIAMFGDLTPGKIMITDEYGRISGASYSDDAWINIAVNDNMDSPSISITHADAQAASSTVGQSADATLSFGEGFTTIQTGIDSKGHVKTLEAKTITLPLPSLSTTGSGILTGLALDPSAGKFDATYTNINDILLTGYQKSLSSGALAAVDSLKEALSKIENNIEAVNTLASETSSNLTQEVSDRKAAITSIEGQIGAETAARQTAIGTINSDLQSLSNRATQLETSVTGINSTLQTLDTDIQGLDAGVQGLNSSIGEINTKTSETAEEVESIKNSIIENETQGLLRWYSQETEPEDLKALWFDSLNNAIKIYNGTTWVSLLVA